MHWRAVEHAKITARAIVTGDKRDGSDKDWKCVKFDRQVVAIAKSRGCSLIITEDSGLSALATIAGIEAMKVLQCPANIRRIADNSLAGLSVMFGIYDSLKEFPRSCLRFAGSPCSTRLCRASAVADE